MRNLGYTMGMKYNMLRYGLAILLAVGLVNCATGIKPPARAKRIDRTLEVTGYCDGRKCTNWKRNWTGRTVIATGPNKGQPKKVGVTASGTKAKPGVIAADTSVYPFGTVMYIPGYGYGRVEDRGGAIKGQKIDLFFKGHQQALNWGRQKVKVAIWLPS